MTIKKKASELRPGDHIQVGEWAYGWAVVERIKDGYALLFRPYMHFSDGCGVSYVGHESFKLPLNSEEYYVVERHIDRPVVSD